MALIGFLAGVLVAVFTQPRIVIPQAPLQKPSRATGVPEGCHYILPESLPTATLPAPDELTLVEGIGKRWRRWLHAAGIHNSSSSPRLRRRPQGNPGRGR